MRFYKYFHKIYELSLSNNAWLLLVFFSILTLLPIIVIGIYNGADLPQHIQFADTFERSVASGDFYPSWAADENLGYGSLGVRFYPPLTSFIFGSVHFVMGDWHTAIWITLLFFTLLGSFGSYLWAKEVVLSSKAIWAGVAFTLMPYHLHEIYNASMYAEFAGYCVIPFSFLFITRICRDGNLQNVLGLAISYAVLVLTHLPSTVFGSPMLCLYGIVLLFQTKNSLNFIKLSLAVAFGLSASSIYWVKMVSEMEYMRNAKFSSFSEHFNYKNQFLLDVFNFSNYELIYFTLIGFSLFALVLGILFSLIYLKFYKIKKEIIAVIIVFFVSIFLTTPFSKPIWMVMPFLQQVQFPWRLLTISSISSSILLVASIESIWNLSNYSQNWKKVVRQYLGSIFLVFLFIWVFIGIQYFRNFLSPAQFNVMAAEKSQAMGFEWFWTSETKEEAFLIKDKVIVANRKVSIINWQSTERSFTVENGTETNARIATLFYPNWRATVNNEPVEVKPAGDGAMFIPIPAEKSTVKLWFQEPFYVILAKYISILTWLFFGLIGLFYCSSKTKILNFVGLKQSWQKIE